MPDTFTNEERTWLLALVTAEIERYKITMVRATTIANKLRQVPAFPPTKEGDKQ